MALIIEDGTIVADANSYVDVVDARLYADLRGLALPVDDTELEKFLIRAMDYLEARRVEYQGKKVEPTQSLQWPRCGIIYECIEIENAVDPDPWFMPKELIAAQVQLAVEQESGTPLFPPPISDASDTTGLVIKEQIGPLLVEYSDKVISSDLIGEVDPKKPVFIASVETLLRPLFDAGCGQSRAVVSMRV